MADNTMIGLDKILERITAEAKGEADRIAAEACADADDILAESAARAEERCAAIIADARSEAALVEHIARSGSELEGRKLLLATRQQIIDEVIAEALKRLRGLPVAEYFGAVKRLATRVADKGAGELVLSAKDKVRLPAGFIDELNKALPEGKSLTLANDTVETDGGFVLRYGGIEENCAFEAIALQNRERLSDELGALMF